MRDNWKIKRLGEICITYAGGTPNRSYIHYYGGKIPWVSSGEVNQSKIFETKEYITENGLRFSSTKWIPKDAILIAMYGATAGQVSKLKINATSNQAVLAVIPKEDDDEFIYYTLKESKEKILYLAQGSGQPNLSKALIDNTIVNLPPLPQQRKIAQILSTCDTVIEKTEAAIAKYQAIKQGMMHDLFTRGIDLETGKLRPKYEEAPELYKESELGMIPREWEVKRLEEIAQIKVSNVDKKIHIGKKLVLLCNYMDVYTNDFITNGLSFMVGSADSNEISRFSLNEQDVIITKDSETPDDIAVPSVVIEKLKNVVCGYHLAILSPYLNVLNGEFLMYNFKIPAVQKYFFRIASGSTRYGLTIGGIQNANFATPTIEEQLVIKSRLRTIDQKHQTEQTTLSKYRQIKSGLMQDLLSGEVEVQVGEGEK